MNLENGKRRAAIAKWHMLYAKAEQSRQEADAQAALDHARAYLKGAKACKYSEQLLGDIRTKESK